MRKLYALCLVTLLAVLVDVVLFHSRTANAQNAGNYKIVEVDPYRGNNVSLAGTVVGFSCVGGESLQKWCYALTKE